MSFIKPNVASLLLPTIDGKPKYLPVPITARTPRCWDRVLHGILNTAT